MGPSFPRQHYQAGVGHNQRVGLHLDNGADVLDIRFDLAVMRQDVDGKIELFAQSMRLGDTYAKIMF